MSSRMRSLMQASACALLGVFVVACGDTGKSNKPNDHAPIVSAKTLGLGKPDAANVYHARAGSKVILTGKDSDGVDDPILQYQWEQIDYADDDKVELVERDLTTRTFTAPLLADARDLKFRLTVTDVDHKQSEDTVTVHVQPVADVDRFLAGQKSVSTKPIDKEKMYLCVHTANDSLATGDIAFDIVTRQWIWWPDRVDAATIYGPAVVSSRPGPDMRAFATGGTIAAGTSGVVVSADVPQFDIDQVNVTLEGANRRDKRIELYSIGKIARGFEFTAQSSQSDLVVSPTTATGGCANTLADTDVALLQPSNAQSVMPESVTPPANLYDADKIRRKLELESVASAVDYYHQFDPDGNKDTLHKWLVANGFQDENGNRASDIAHAVYTNNFDLGFGRDMYLRKDDQGNVFSYVVNYPSLDAAVRGVGDFAVVAMEYSAPSQPTCDPAKKFVRFYAFVPDKLNGGHVRANTMNFDGRGEKSVPGVCIACHGGTSKSEFNSCADTDIGAAFMPWDLGSFLFADTDPDLEPVVKQGVPEQYRPYTLAAQQTALRQLNEGALTTYKEDTTGRFANVIDLIHGWYHKSADDGEVDVLPANDFDDSYTPTGWADKAAVYHGVLARHCRACHILTPPSNDMQFHSEENFVSRDRANTIKRYVFDEGAMPAARLTMDRFWVPFSEDDASSDGAPSGLLRNFLNDKLGASSCDPASPAISDVAMPGVPVPRFEVSSDASAYAIGAATQINSTATVYGVNPLWSASSTCDNRNDILSTLTGVSTAITPRMPGCDYLVSLSAENQFGQRVSTCSKITSADHVPHVKDFSTAKSYQANVSVDFKIDVKSALQSGDTSNCTAGTSYCAYYFGDRTNELPSAIDLVDSQGALDADGSMTVGAYTVSVDTGAVAKLRIVGPAPNSSQTITFNYRLRDEFFNQVSVNTSDASKSYATITLTLAQGLFAGELTQTRNAQNSDNQAAYVGCDASVRINIAGSNSVSGGTGAGTYSLLSVGNSAQPASADNPSHGTVSVANGHACYMPDKGYVGPDSFKYVVRDSNNVTASGVVRVAVNPTVTFSGAGTQTVTSLSEVFGSCAGASCHTNTVGSQPHWTDYSNLISLLNHGVASAFNSGSYRINCDNLAASMLLTVPTTGIVVPGNPPGNLHDGNFFGPTVLNPLRHWLEEGARNNSTDNPVDLEGSPGCNNPSNW